MSKQYAYLAFAVTVLTGTSGCGTSDPGSLGQGGISGGGAAGAIIHLDGGHGGSGGGSGTSTLPPGSLNMVVRDFKFYDPNDPKTNPDFENVPKVDQNRQPCNPQCYGPWDDPDIVTDTLGSDYKPVYNNPTDPLTTHGKAAFDQWYNTVDGTNIMQQLPLTLTKNAAGTYSYDSQSAGPPYSPNNNGFFPIDDGSAYATAFGNQGQDDKGVSHNFSFTVEIHTVFTYNGGETFDFRGDDDVFVYINNKRVINLGGIHGAETQNVAVDSLGLTKGESYPLDFFYAERHVVQSNMLITTTLDLANNGDIPIY